MVHIEIKEHELIKFDTTLGIETIENGYKVGWGDSKHYVCFGPILDLKGLTALRDALIEAVDNAHTSPEFVNLIKESKE